MKNNNKEQKMLLLKQKTIEEIKETYSKSAYRFIHLTAKKLTELKDRPNFQWPEPRGLHYAINFVRFLEEGYGEKYMYGVVMKAES